MRVWTYICKECECEETFAEDEVTEECPECGEDMYNTDEPTEE